MSAISSAEKMTPWRPPRSRPKSHGESETWRLRLQFVHTMRKSWRGRPQISLFVRPRHGVKGAVVMREVVVYWQAADRRAVFFHRRAAPEPAETFASRLPASVSASMGEQTADGEPTVAGTGARGSTGPLLHRPPPIPPRPGPQVTVHESTNETRRPARETVVVDRQAGSEAQAARA